MICIPLSLLVLYSATSGIALGVLINGVVSCFREPS
jgi:hypothetical protein